MAVSARTLNKAGKPALFAALSLPVLWLAWNWGLAVSGGNHVLTVNPIEYTNRYLGDWAFRYLLAALAISPVADLTGFRRLILFRRMVGLFAFAYACLHVSSYLGLDLFFDWQAFWEDILKRNYITVGMAALLLLTPLAVTSTNNMVKRLGAARWRRLHRLVYPAAILVALHYIMMVKSIQLEPLIYAGILALLLGFRLIRRQQKEKPGSKEPGKSST